MDLVPGSRPVPDAPEFVLVRKLGAGAFGEVWRAHGPGGTHVALKFIRLDPQIFATEMRSLEVMKGIRHPNLVSLFGVWYCDGHLILAMELCDRTLHDRLDEALSQNLGGIPLPELLAYMNDAGSGLDELNATVQHRDVKPANLLLLNSSVKVADFGLAKALAQTVATNSGAGTIAYLAPECFKGHLTRQSDQYSLAVTYFHLRTGRLLFAGDQAEMMYGHLQQPPDLSKLPTAERAALARALAKEPAHRWPSCKAFVGELLGAEQVKIRLREQKEKQEREAAEAEAERRNFHKLQADLAEADQERRKLKERIFSSPEHQRLLELLKKHGTAAPGDSKEKQALDDLATVGVVKRKKGRYVYPGKKAKADNFNTYMLGLLTVAILLLGFIIFLVR